MVSKQKKQKNFSLREQDPYLAREREKYDHPLPSREFILQQLENEGAPMFPDELAARPPMQHVVVTGRGAPPALIELADTATDMQLLKHAFASGIAAQPGIEW